MDKEIELAKSWFELAKILATIAGFLAITAGIFLAYMINALSTSMYAMGELEWNSTYNINVSGPLLNTIPSAFNLAWAFLFSAVIIGFAAIFFWIFGYQKLGRIKERKI